MGGLRQYMPVTFVTWDCDSRHRRHPSIRRLLVKDEILWQAFGTSGSMADRRDYRIHHRPLYVPADVHESAASIAAVRPIRS